MKSSYIFLLLILLIACGKKEESISPQYRPIVEAVYASGSLHPVGEYKAFANATGLLRNIHVREGDSLSPNTLLFEVESRDPQLRSQNAREALAYARANASTTSPMMAELSANIANAQAKFEGDSLSYARTKELYAGNAVTKAELDRVSALYQSSKAALQAAEMRYATTSQTVANQLQQAERQFELATTTQNNFQVRSYRKGKVYALYKEEGEMVTNQQPVALIGDADAFVLRLVIDASDVARVKTGQEVLYTLDAFPDSIFHARVSKVYPQLENETQSFRVDAECSTKPAIPYAGTQVQANIIITQKEKALIIPRAYLQPGNMVFVKDGSDIKSQHVKTGILNLEHAEILSGIDEKTILVKKK